MKIRNSHQVVCEGIPLIPLFFICMSCHILVIFIFSVITATVFRVTFKTSKTSKLSNLIFLYKNLHAKFINADGIGCFLTSLSAYIVSS